MSTKETPQEIQQQNAVPETEQNGFDSIMPTIQKLLVWLIYITGFGLICFPYLALTVEPKHAIHLWILSAIDLGLFLALLNFKRFVVGNTLQQNIDDSNDDKKQDAISSNNSNNSSKKQQQPVLKKNKKE